MTASKKYVRWHDRQPQLAQAVRALCLMPDEVCTIISESVILLMHRDFREVLLDKQFRTLGHEKILGLHKSKNRRREYDVNDTLHKAMNTLYLLSHESQDYVAREVMTMVEYIQRYLATCYEFQQNASAEDVARITKSYVEEGSEEVEFFLQNLREMFYLQGFSRRSDQPPAATQPDETETAVENAKDTGKGLRIRKRLKD